MSWVLASICFCDARWVISGNMSLKELEVVASGVGLVIAVMVCRNWKLGWRDPVSQKWENRTVSTGSSGVSSASGVFTTTQ